MSDWGNAFDEQCRAEGLEVPEKTETVQSNSEMDHNEENKGFGGAGVSRGGMFGGGMKTSGPPPQTSFGATSGTRVGGSFGTAGGPDGRGAAIGSSEELNGGGNVISVGHHRDRSACTLTRYGGSSTNRTNASAPTTIKTNHEGGRFGVLSPRSFNSVSSESVEQPKQPTGGRFGASQASGSGSSVGGAFGSRPSIPSPTIAAPKFSFNIAKVESPTLPKSFGGAFGSSKPTVPTFGGAPTANGSGSNLKSSLSVGGGFGSNMKSASGADISSKSSVLAVEAYESKAGESLLSATVRNSSTIGEAEPSKLPAPSTESYPIRAGGSFGSSTKPPTSTGGAFGVKPLAPLSGAHVTKAGGSFGSSMRPPTTTGGAFGAKSTTTINEPHPTRAGGNFGSSTRSSTTTTGSFGVKSSLPVNESNPEKMGGSFGFPATSTPQSSELGVRSSIPAGESFEPPSDDVRPSGGGFKSNNSNTVVQNKSTVGGAFGASKSNSGTSVGGAFGRSSANVGESKNSQQYQSGSGFATRQPLKNSNASPFGRPPVNSPMSSEGKENQATVSQVERPEDALSLSATNSSQDIQSFGGSMEGKSTSSDKMTTSTGSDNNKHQTVPFMPGPPPPMRGGFQGGFRGGRGGGQIDFGGPGQGPMGRGRGQPNPSFVPQQRAPPPQFAAAPQQSVRPDPKYKYTKSTDTDPHEKVPVPADIALLNKFIQKEVKMMKDTVVDVQRQDPKSPLYSISSFRELRLKPEVLQALDNLNFQFPTRIQETALPLLLMEPPSNLIAQAQSGTGKTAAFVLTMLCRIDVNLKCPQCICLAPTLELAKQIGEVVEKMGRYIENLKIHYAIKGGNMAAMRGRKLTEQIVIGTPGITRDYLQKYKCIDPSQIRCLVLDEADVMIYHQGFTDISTTIYKTVEEASDSVQSMLFSATYDEPVINFATKIIKNAIVVMLKREEQALPNIKQFYVQCACRDSKYAAIVNLYSGLAVASSVIFCHTKASVMWLYENMKARGHKVDVLHGDMNVVERADTIIRFKRGDFKVLITTNVFARGIDVAQVSVVINYDLPIKYNEQDMPMVIDGFTQPDCETYLHRIGRTGRFGKTGIAINLIDSEDSMNMINVLENHFQMKIARMDPSNIVELEAIEMA